MRDPVHRAEFVEDCTTNTRSTIRFKLDAAFHIKRVDRIHQAKDPRGHQVINIDLIWQFRVDAFCVIANQWEIKLHQFVAHRLGRLGLVLHPDLLDLLLLFGCGFSMRLPDSGHGPLLDRVASTRPCVGGRYRKNNSIQAGEPAASYLIVVLTGARLNRVSCVNLTLVGDRIFLDMLLNLFVDAAKDQCPEQRSDQPGKETHKQCAGEYRHPVVAVVHANRNCCGKADQRETCCNDSSGNSEHSVASDRS